MNEGWAEYLDKTGTPCAYCDKPSTRTLVVVPDEWANDKLKRRGTRVGLCDDCRPQIDGGPATVNGFHRRRAKGVEQLTMDIRDDRSNAIFKGDAA